VAWRSPFGVLPGRISITGFVFISIDCGEARENITSERNFNLKFGKWSRQESAGKKETLGGETGGRGEEDAQMRG